MRRSLATLLTAFLLAVPAVCATADDLKVKSAGFKVTFEPSKSAWGEQFRQNAIKENLYAPLIEALGELIPLKQQIPVTFRDCGFVNAFWNPDDKSLTMCYELMELMHNNYPVIAKNNALIKDAGEDKVVRGTTIFIFMHELGHGLVDLFNIPVTGKEEDAVDQFAVVLLATLDREAKLPIVENVIYGAEFFKSISPATLDRTDFADVHALGVQRFYDTQCLILGYDDERFDPILAKGMMKALPEVQKLIDAKAPAADIDAALQKYDEENIIPAIRAKTCEENWKKAEKSWTVLTDTFVK